MGQCFNFYVIVNFGNTQALATLPGEFSAELVCTFTTTFIGQLFFARQVHVFRKTAWHLSVLITALSVMGFGFGTALCAELIMHGTTLTSTTVIKITASISLSANLLSNIIASGALCTLLTTSKKDVFSSTNGVLTKLTIYTLTRGLLVAFVQAGFLVTYVAGPDEIWWVPLHLILSKVYVNSLLACLNARVNLRPKLQQRHSVLTHTEVTFAIRPRNSLDTESLSMPNIDVSGSRETCVENHSEVSETRLCESESSEAFRTKFN
ncbi:hypothetical protein SISNIDRAFT_551375 [Sistotremastrum niveocremeum HHB9708]|uniref:DUF6534 domain-containing protein n=1 Tax=Sistotremastrum niveocremeum HHB9708 TaxID=1314777 RepID=A0A164RRB1_9AGAM|nr:hypothetical protein SISNIDRAFT_551375 [Sistotremastrum niveocremeum HHB9708]